MVEADTDVEDTILYYGTDDGATVGAHFAFNFQLIEKLDDSSTARDVVDAVNQWIDYLPLQYTANWIVSITQNLICRRLKETSFASLETIIITELQRDLVRITWMVLTC